MDTPPLDVDAIRWSAPPEERADRPLLVLLHGYGSDENDLFALGEHLPAEFVLASVRAPLSPPFPAPGWSWYPIDDLDSPASAGVTAAADRLWEWLSGISAPSVGLLGFSQGAVIAQQTLRRHPGDIDYVVALSGYVDAGPLPTDPLLRDTQPPVFWGRGSEDAVIPAARIAHTTLWLPEHVDLSGRVYPGLGHGVSAAEIDDIRTFLEKRLSPDGKDG